MNVQTVSIEVGGRPMTIETGKLAKQANGSVVIRQDDSMVLVTACATKDDVPFDFLPLTVVYQDRTAASGSIPGGFLILSEKVIGENEKEDALQQDMHYAFKRIQGYSDIEIKKKQSSLKDVLIPETVSQHKDRLQKLGFIVNGPWFQYLNFISMIARV